MKITNHIKYIRTIKKDKDISHFFPLYKVKRNNKIYFTFKDTTPPLFLKKLHINKWAFECAYTFSLLPKLPKPFSASEYAKKHNISHVTAKKILLKEKYYKYIQIDKWYFIENPKCNYYLFQILISSSETRSLINAINKIQEFPLILEPNKSNLINIIKEHSFQVLIYHNILNKIKVPKSKKYYYYVPRFFYEY